MTQTFTQKHTSWSELFSKVERLFLNLRDSKYVKFSESYRPEDETEGVWFGGKSRKGRKGKKGRKSKKTTKKRRSIRKKNNAKQKSTRVQSKRRGKKTRIKRFAEKKWHTSKA